MKEARQGCFCFRSSSSRRKHDKGKVQEKEAANFGKSEEILSDFSTFSVKEQQKSFRKAVKEEKAANREAERVVQWVKQASARFDQIRDDQFN